MFGTKTTVETIKAAVGLQTQGTETSTPNLNGTVVETGNALGLTQSMMEQFSSSPVDSPKPLHTRKTEEPEVSQEIHKDMLLTLQRQFAIVQKALAENKGLQTKLEERGTNLDTKEADLKQLEQKLNAGTNGVLEAVNQEYKLKRLNPVVTALHLLQNSLPALEIALKKATDANTLAAKNEFAQALSIVVGNAIKNALLISNKEATNSKDSEEKKDTAKVPSLEDLRAFLLSDTGTKVFLTDHQASKDLEHFLELAIKAAKNEPVDAALTKKEIWMNRFWATASSMYPIITTSGLYVAGAEGFPLSFAPECINDIVLFMQEYAGSAAAPLFLFAVGYMIYYMVQLGYMAKERVRPTSDEVKAARTEAEWANKFAQNAITV